VAVRWGSVRRRRRRKTSRQRKALVWTSRASSSWRSWWYWCCLPSTVPGSRATPIPAPALYLHRMVMMGTFVCIAQQTLTPEDHPTHLEPQASTSSQICHRIFVHGISAEINSVVVYVNRPAIFQPLSVSDQLNFSHIFSFSG